jgi:23S rRNA G2069 N7-methylase RlmK/C1962 C5-methylase RlmI
MFNPEFLTTDNNDCQEGNGLIQYLQEQSPDVLQRVAKSASNDIQDIIRHNVQGLLGMLPGEQFEVKVTANRDNLASLLASAMMTGYFLRQMEQRKELEESLFADEAMAVDTDDLNL